MGDPVWLSINDFVPLHLEGFKYSLKYFILGISLNIIFISSNSSKDSSTVKTYIDSFQTFWRCPLRIYSSDESSHYRSYNIDIWYIIWWRYAQMKYIYLKLPYHWNMCTFFIWYHSFLWAVLKNNLSCEEDIYFHISTVLLI